MPLGRCAGIPSKWEAGLFRRDEGDCVDDLLGLHVCVFLHLGLSRGFGFWWQDKPLALASDRRSKLRLGP